MEKLEKRIIEIRDDIQFLDEKMNKSYSDYEVAKDKREDAEVNLEILINQRKDIASKIIHKQISRVSLVFVPLNFILFGYLTYTNINLNRTYIFNDIIMILSSIFLSVVSSYILSFIFVKIIKHFEHLDKIIFLSSNEISNLFREERRVNKKIKSTNKSLKEYKSLEKENAELYSKLCLKYNSSKALLDEIETDYFDKTKLIKKELKTSSLYNLLNSLNEDDREYIVESIKNIFLNYTE